MTPTPTPVINGNFTALEAAASATNFPLINGSVVPRTTLQGDNA